MARLKLWLDDERPAPRGWTPCRWPSEVIAHMQLAPERVHVVSLDHDLGDDAKGTGYDVLAWIEEMVATQGFTPPLIQIHTANPAARLRMNAAADAIARRAAARGKE